MTIVVAQTVIFCSSSNILLRGDFEDIEKFLKVYQFRIDPGDEELKKHLLAKLAVGYKPGMGTAVRPRRPPWVAPKS